jgi:hypothetical protein
MVTRRVSLLETFSAFEFNVYQYSPCGKIRYTSRQHDVAKVFQRRQAFFHPALLATSKTTPLWFMSQILFLLNMIPALRKILKLTIPCFAGILVVLADSRNLPVGVTFLNFVHRIGGQSYGAELAIGLSQEIRSKGYGAVAMRYLIDQGRV